MRREEERGGRRRGVFSEARGKAYLRHSRAPVRIVTYYQLTCIVLKPLNSLYTYIHYLHTLLTYITYIQVQIRIAA